MRLLNGIISTVGEISQFVALRGKKIVSSFLVVVMLFTSLTPTFAQAVEVNLANDDVALDFAPPVNTLPTDSWVADNKEWAAQLSGLSYSSLGLAISFINYFLMMRMEGLNPTITATATAISFAVGIQIRQHWQLYDRWGNAPSLAAAAFVRAKQSAAHLALVVGTVTLSQMASYFNIFGNSVKSKPLSADAESIAEDADGNVGNGLSRRSLLAAENFIKSNVTKLKKNEWAIVHNLFRYLTQREYRDWWATKVNYMTDAQMNVHSFGCRKGSPRSCDIFKYADYYKKHGFIRYEALRVYVETLGSFMSVDLRYVQTNTANLILDRKILADCVKFKVCNRSDELR